MSSIARPIAARLTKQHRMHPDIAALVSRVFYDGALETDESKHEYFQTVECPVATLDSNRLPGSPIVWIDMPWVQSTKNQKVGDSAPKWSNEDERRAVLHVLGLLSPAAKTQASIAVLSPYAQQVRLLEEDIQRHAATQLNNLTRFAKSVNGPRIVHTVDSFQGNEADVVLVSLVRNNPHGSIKRALGFLSNSKRMNVLLSRARWRLIIVGSLEFLGSIVTTAKSPQDAEEIEFLKELVCAVTDADSPVEVVSFHTLLGLAK